MLSRGTVSLVLLLAISGCGGDESGVALPRGSGGASEAEGGAGGSASQAGGSWQQDAGGAAGSQTAPGSDEFSQACAAVRSWKLACTTDTGAADLVEQMCLAAKPCADAIYIAGAATAILECIMQSSCDEPGDVGSTCLPAAETVLTVESKLAHQDYTEQCSSGMAGCEADPWVATDPLNLHICAVWPFYNASYYAALSGCVSSCTSEEIQSCAKQQLEQLAPACASEGWVFGHDLPYPNAN